MNNILVVTASLVALLVNFSVRAQDLGLQNLDSEDFRKVVGEFSANSMHSSVSGAGTLGDIFGLEFGLLAGMTNTPEINTLAQETGNEIEKVPHAALLGIVSVPFGLSVEAGFIPKIGNDDFKYNAYSLAVKWTPTALFFEWPVDLAIKLHTSKVDMEFQQTVSSVNTAYDFENSVTGVTAYISKDFIFVAPYLGFGTVNAKGDLNVSGFPAFDPTYTASSSASETRSGTVMMVGSEFKLLVVKVGVEYARLFDTDRYTGKLAFYF